MTTIEHLIQGREQTVLVYGTSLTAEGAWTLAMREWFAARFPGLVTFINSGGSGQNSDWGREHLNDKVLAHRPDLVFIEFSYNDAHVKFNLPLSRSQENLTAIVHGIRQQNPGADIVLQTMNLPWDCPTASPSARDRPHLAAYNELVRRHAAHARLSLVDHEPVWKERMEASMEDYRRLVPDGSHPSPDASCAITWPTIKAFLEAEVPGIRSSSIPTS